MRSRSSLMALTSTWLQKRRMAVSVWRFSRSQSSMVIRSRSPRRPCSRRIASSARAIAILSPKLETLHPKKTSGEVQRRGQPPGREHRRPAAGFDEVELLVELDAIGDAQPPVEIQQVDAAAQQHVLAVVDDLGAVAGAGQRIRSSAAAQESARFVKIHFESGLAQRRGGCQSGQAAADHDRCGHQINSGGWSCLQDCTGTRSAMPAASAAVDQHNCDGEHNHDETECRRRPNALTISSV